MADLATVDDVELRVGRALTSDERFRVAGLLADASSMVRAVTGRPFGTATFTVRRQLDNGQARLAMRDISAVVSVKTVAGVDLDAVWDGLHYVRVGSPVAFDSDARVDVVDITLTRAGPDAPQWVVAIVAQMAARALGRPADTTGVTFEQIAGYSYSVGQAGAAGGVGLLPYEERQLRQSFPPPPAVAWLVAQ